MPFDAIAAGRVLEQVMSQKAGELRQTNQALLAFKIKLLIGEAENKIQHMMRMEEQTNTANIQGRWNLLQELTRAKSKERLEALKPPEVEWKEDPDKPGWEIGYYKGTSTIADQRKGGKYPKPEEITPPEEFTAEESRKYKALTEDLDANINYARSEINKLKARQEDPLWRKFMPEETAKIVDEIAEWEKKITDWTRQKKSILGQFTPTGFQSEDINDPEDLF